MTTDHLPECPVIAGDGLCGICQEDRCICPELRACEHRVLSGPMSMPPYLSGRRRGYVVGLDEARKAVAALRKPEPTFYVLEVQNAYDMAVLNALAAIDELRNPPTLPPTKGRAHKY